MYPVLAKIGPLPINTYGLMMAIGVLFAVYISTALAKKQGIETNNLFDMFFYTILIGLIGAKVFLFVTEYEEYTRDFDHFKDLLFSGGTFYGGLIFGALFAVWYMRKHKINIGMMGDAIAPAVALAHFFGRVGCFFAGCCWGRECDHCPIGVQFPTSAYLRYPTQLIEAGLNFLNFIILMFFFKRKKFTGQILIMYIFNYSIIRFCVEYFRGDTDRGYVFGGMDHPFTSYSVPQLISTIGIIIAIILFIHFRKKGLSDQKG